MCISLVLDNDFVVLLLQNFDKRHKKVHIFELGSYILTLTEDMGRKSTTDKKDYTAIELISQG